MQFFNIYKEDIFWGIAGVFGLALILQLFYYLFFYARLMFHKKKKSDFDLQPVSIIICARNEYDNLKAFLPLIMAQDYPDFEVVVVDDNSADETRDILRQFTAKHPNLKITTLNREPVLTYAKKLAQTVGIKAAKNELLLFTDADCRINSDKWLLSMVGNFSPNTEVVLGYGGYIKQKGLIDKLVRYETLIIAMQYFSYALAGVPYMGVGRNLAYRKTTFFKNRGFASHAQLESGDDDLFVNEVARKFNTKIEISKESHTRSVPETTWKDWIRQKRRHITTGKRYRTLHKILLTIEIISRELFYFSFIALIISEIYWEYVLGAFGFRMLIQLIIIKMTMKRLNEKDLLLYSLAIDFTLPFVYISLMVRNYIRTKRNRWN